MKVLVTGSSGLVGSRLMPRLEDAGHQVLRLIRRPVRDPETEIRWTPSHGRIDREGVARADAVIHLAGKNLAAGRWTERLKEEIHDSRYEGTLLLSETLSDLAASDRAPKVLISASASGYYGDRGEEVLTEDSPPGDGFLADVCIDWENATNPAREAGVRVVNTRFGVILAPEDGMLPKILPLFRAGLGGTIGSGRQWFAWIHIEDVVSALLHALNQDEMKGPVNVVAPNPVRHQDFVKALGRELNRPTVIPVPKRLVEIGMGHDMAHDTILTSQNIHPERLMKDGFEFRYPRLEPALADCI